VHTTELATKTSVSFLSHSRLFRETIAARLKLEEGICFVAAAGSIHQLRRHLNGRPLDIVLVHTNIDGVLGRELACDAKSLLPATHLIVLAFRRSKQDLARWVEAGAMAYLEQEASTVELLATIRDIAQGGHPRCSMSLLARIVEPHRQMTLVHGRPGAELLSDHELEIAIRQPSGLANKTSRHQMPIQR
jgi:DNA-binding NarL/FixJ family response regulator